jgi:hypothetical protein
VAFEFLDPPAIAATTNASGPTSGGTLLTILGSNFATDPSTSMWVRFDDLVHQRANPLTLTQCSAVSPPSDVVGPVEVTVTVDSIPAVLADGFTYGEAVGVVPPAERVPAVLALAAGPSPFSGRATFGIALPRAAAWQLDVMDVRGAVVRRFSGRAEAGEHQVVWDGRSGAGWNSPPGVYFAKLAVLGEQRIRRIVKLD